MNQRPQAFLFPDLHPEDSVKDRIACPTLLLHGDSIAGVLDHEDIEQALSLNPRIVSVNIPGGGHNIHVNDPKTVLQVVRHFLHEHVQHRRKK